MVLPTYIDGHWEPELMDVPPALVDATRKNLTDDDMAYLETLLNSNDETSTSTSTSPITEADPAGTVHEVLVELSLDDVVLPETVFILAVQEHVKIEELTELKVVLNKLGKPVLHGTYTTPAGKVTQLRRFLKRKRLSADGTEEVETAVTTPKAKKERKPKKEPGAPIKIRIRKVKQALATAVAVQNAVSPTTSGGVQEFVLLDNGTVTPKQKKQRKPRAPKKAKIVEEKILEEGEIKE